MAIILPDLVYFTINTPDKQGLSVFSVHIDLTRIPGFIEGMPLLRMKLLSSLKLRRTSRRAGSGDWVILVF